jgi:hypothetical protein
MSTIPSAGCVGLDVDGVTVQVRLAPGKTVEDLTAADLGALEELVALCREQRPAGVPRACCPVCMRSVRLVRQGHAGLHLDGVGRNCPGSGLVIA